MNPGKKAVPVTYSAVVSTANADQSPVLSAVVPVLIYGLRLTVDLPRNSITAKNLARTGEGVINLPGAETIAAIERLARIVTVDGAFDFTFSKLTVGGRFAAAHMTLVPSEAVSAPRALECPMQLEVRIEGDVNPAMRERIVRSDNSRTFELNVLRVHLDSSMVLGGVRPNMWTPLMASLREAYRTSSAP